MSKTTQNNIVVVETTHFNIHNFMYTANTVINQQARARSFEGPA